MKTEHEYNERGFCKLCGWERQFMEKAGRACAGTVQANPDLVSSPTVDKNPLSGGTVQTNPEPVASQSVDSNPFKGFPFERLRFEYERRERKVAEIRDEKRRCDDEYYENISKNMMGSESKGWSDWHRDNCARFSKETKALEQELEQIEEAMNA
jgi:hypothetical protein